MITRAFMIVFILALSIFWPLPSNAQGQSTEERDALVSQCNQLHSQGKYVEAIPVAEKIRSLTEKMYGPDHVETAAALNNLAFFYQATARYGEAEPLYKRSLGIMEKTLGENHPDIADPLNNLAMLYRKTGRYAEAIPLFKRAIEIRERTLGKDHLDVASSLNQLALLYLEIGQYDEAEPLFRRALEIREARLGKDHPDVAIILNNLAVLYTKTGQFAEAEKLYKRALEITETSLGKNHLDVALPLSNLAGLYETMERYAEAELLMKRALEIREKVLGQDHLHVANSLNNLAGIYFKTGRYAESELLFKRTLQILETKFGKDNPYLHHPLNNLAVLYVAMRRYSEALQLQERSLEIKEAKLGKDHPDVATSLNNLADMHRKAGQYDEAEKLYKRALEIQEARLGKDHPEVATSLNNLAWICTVTGRYSEAEPMYTRALEIMETKLGNNHSNIAISLTNLAEFYGATEKYTSSQRNLLKATAIDEHVRENVFLILDDKQKLSYVAQQRGSIERLLALTSRHLQKDRDAVQDTLNAWLRWKGAVTEFQGRLTEVCSRAENLAVIGKCDELMNVRRTLASLLNAKPEKMDFENYLKTLAEYEGKKSALEAELSRLSADFRLEKLVGTADIPTIASILPRGSAYLDFAVIQPYDFKQKRFEDKPRCLAFVLIPGDPPHVGLVDLGFAEAIDRRIGDYHKVIREAVDRKRPPDIDTLRQHLKALYGLVLEPLLPHINDRKQLFVSPDGSLNLIPFDAFITPGGKYLVEEHSIQYIAAGRDIVRFKDKAVAREKALILADPDYDLGEQKRIEVARQMGVSEFQVRGGSSRDAVAMTFKRLPDTRKEAEAIQKTMKQGEVTCRQDKEAIQEVLFAAASPRVLHIATHGYFLPDQKIAPQWGPGKETLPPDPLNAYENPMLRSGIALAGANTSQRQGKDYGMVSAEKVLGLKLKGTELVVLSACETGVGEVETGEGVFGLKRAFILSGAKTVVMSLWSVPSKETADLMVMFYTKWSGDKTKAEALREAKLELMKENPNPFFWGAFVMVGDPGK